MKAVALPESGRHVFLRVPELGALMLLEPRGKGKSLSITFHFSQRTAGLGPLSVNHWLGAPPTGLSRHLLVHNSD